MSRSKRDEFTRTLGATLRRHRGAAGLTRRELLARMDADLASKTVATYETGSRKMTVDWLLEFCHAMNKDPVEVLNEAYQQVFDPTKATTEVEVIWVNLDFLARNTLRELQPLRRWAATHALDTPRGRGVDIPLGPLALDSMTALCGIDRAELTRLLTAQTSVRTVCSTDPTSPPSARNRHDQQRADHD